MRILILSNYYPPLEIGGWEQLTRDVAQELRSRGNEMAVLTSNYRAEPLPESEPAVARVLHLESPDPIHYHPVYALWQRVWESQNRFQLSQAVRTFRPDIIFINGMWNLSPSLACMAEQLLPQGVVYYMASTWPTDIDTHSAYWAIPTRRIWLRPFKQIAGALANKLLLYRTQSSPAFEHVLCVSNYIRQHLVEQARILPEHTTVVHNGIDPDVFRMRNDLEAPCGTLRLLYAGRLVPEKGAHIVIEALGLLRDRQVQLPITLTILGSGSPAYESHLKRCVAEQSLDNVIEFRGQVARESMPKILTEHDVLVLSSVWQEPLARMTQEAMACGLVVIGSATGGTPEILINGENGFTFPAKDACMLADKIEMVATNHELRIRIARAVRRTVEERFSFDRMVDEIEGYFAKLLDKAEIASTP